MEIKFTGYNIFLHTFKSNRDSFRVEIDCGKDDYHVLKEIPEMPEGAYEIIIKPILDGK